MFPAWKDVVRQEPLTVQAVNGLQTSVKQAIGLPMLGRAQSGGVPSAKWQRDVGARCRSIDLQDTGLRFGEKPCLDVAIVAEQRCCQAVAGAIAQSQGVLEIVGFLERDLGLQLRDNEIVPENLDSIANIASFVERKRSQ